MFKVTSINAKIISTGIVFVIGIAVGSETIAGCNDRANPGVNWQGCDLTGRKLFNADLSNAQLSGANLSGALLSGANLRGANLTAANLSGAHLTGAEMQGADLTGSDIRSVKFFGTDLSNSKWINGLTCDDGSQDICNYQTASVISEGVCFYNDDGSLHHLDTEADLGANAAGTDLIWAQGMYATLMGPGSVSNGQNCPEQAKWDTLVPTACWYKNNGTLTESVFGNPMDAPYWEIREHADVGLTALAYVVPRGYQCPTLIESDRNAEVDTGGGYDVSGPDFHMPPLYGTISLDSKFTPNPHKIEVRFDWGSGFKASDVSDDCNAGRITAEPTYRLSYETSGTTQLVIAAASNVDATLAINDPEGNWICNDDHDPSIVFSSPMTGQYDIWVGAIGEVEESDIATLSITER